MTDFPSTSENTTYPLDALVITRQPPPIFANQQRGKRHGFSVAVRMLYRCTGLTTVKVDLLYADDFTQVPDNSPYGASSKMRKHFNKILQVLQTDKFNAAGEAVVIVRINDISRNYGGRRFCLRLSAVNNGVEIASVHTTPVHVISKYPKNKRSREDESHASDSSPTHVPERKRCRDEINIADKPLVKWIKRAYCLLKSLEKSYFVCGASGVIITKCPACSVFGDLHSLHHASSCPIASLIKQFEQHFDTEAGQEDGITRGPEA